MRKLLISASIMLLAFASHASYLYWQVNTSDSGIVDGKFNNNTIGGYRVVAVAGDYAWGDYHLQAANSTGYDSGSAYTSFGTVYATPANVSGNDVLISQIGDAYSNSTYTYYIEILSTDYSSVIGVGTTGLSYADAHSQGRLVTSLSDISASPLAAWTGGAYAAPEPTSGLLLLVGGALLALRRRRA